jgi:hypothetical protein
MNRHQTNLFRGVPITILSLLVLVPSASAQGPLYTFRADGNFASVYRSEVTASGFKSVSVSVNVGGTADNPSTFLYYTSTERTNGVYTTEYGYGAIPNGSVTTYGDAQHLTVTIDVNTVPGFQIFRSVYTIPCCPGSSSGIHPLDGLIALSWDKTSDRWTRYEGHSMTQLYDLVIHSQGTSSTFSASAQGSIFGQDIAAGGSTSPYASIGTNRSVYMAVEHEQ